MGVRQLPCFFAGEAISEAGAPGGTRANRQFDLIGQTCFRLDLALLHTSG
jgi:hypothetical protein